MNSEIIEMNKLLKGNKISLSELTADEIGDEHISTGIDTPMLSTAFDISDEEKISKIEFHFKEIM